MDWVLRPIEEGLYDHDQDGSIIDKSIKGRRRLEARSVLIINTGDMKLSN